MALSLSLAAIESLCFDISVFLRKNRSGHDQCKSSPSRGGFRWGWGVAPTSIHHGAIGVAGWIEVLQTLTCSSALESPLSNSHKAAMTVLQDAAFQDQYPEKFSHCFGCGKSHPSGLHLKSYWDVEGDPADAIVRVTPPEIYSGGVPGHVYGGMIAALFDCHGTASAAAFACRAEGRKIGDWNLPASNLPPVRYVTAFLTVDFLRPTPQNVELQIRARLLKIEGRKIELEMTLTADDVPSAKARMLAVRFREA